MLNRKLILTTVLSVGLTACSVGPHYKQPAPALPQQFTAPDTATADVSPHADASDPQFWHSFNDPALSSVVQRALADASSVAAIQVTIVGEVASTYIDLRGRQELLRIARENVKNEQETVRLVEAAYSAGRGTQFDTARTRALLETTTSRIPDLLSAIALDEHRLAVLCGLSPVALISELEVATPLPDLPKRIDPGTPADLIRRRPDVSASEERLHAATEQLGIATADLFPRLNF